MATCSTGTHICCVAADDPGKSAKCCNLYAETVQGMSYMAAGAVVGTGLIIAAGSALRGKQEELETLKQAHEQQMKDAHVQTPSFTRIAQCSRFVLVDVGMLCVLAPPEI